MQAMIPETPADPVWEQLAPLLDEAMAQLPDKDRDAIVLPIFKNKSLRDVGEAMGLDEYAAQKRVSRAMEKLRASFARRGRHVQCGGHLRRAGGQLHPGRSGRVGASDFRGRTNRCRREQARRCCTARSS